MQIENEFFTALLPLAAKYPKLSAHSLFFRHFIAKISIISKKELQ